MRRVHSHHATAREQTQLMIGARAARSATASTGSGQPCADQSAAMFAVFPPFGHPLRALRTPSRRKPKRSGAWAAAPMASLLAIASRPGGFPSKIRAARRGESRRALRRRMWAPGTPKRPTPWATRIRSSPAAPGTRTPSPWRLSLSRACRSTWCRTSRDSAGSPAPASSG